MGNGVGTMGMSLLEFMGMWSLMMTAMMLPAVAPVASLYLRTIVSDRPRRLVLFVGGYLVVWATAGIPAYIALRFVDDRVADSTATMRTIAVVVLVAAGVYQLTPLKAVCLRHCRSPLGQLLHYGNIKGRGKDLKVALHHAGFCLGCCWALMALFLAFGVDEPVGHARPRGDRVQRETVAAWRDNRPPGRCRLRRARAARRVFTAGSRRSRAVKPGTHE